MLHPLEVVRRSSIGEVTGYLAEVELAGSHAVVSLVAEAIHYSRMVVEVQKTEMSLLAEPNIRIAKYNQSVRSAFH